MSRTTGFFLFLAVVTGFSAVMWTGRAVVEWTAENRLGSFVTVVGFAMTVVFFAASRSDDDRRGR